MNDRDFNAMIRSRYEQAIAAAEIVSRPVLAQNIAASFPPPEGPSAELDEYCRYRSISDQVMREVRANTQPASEEPTLPGFAWVQQRYSIIRNGELVVVPTQRMTADETEAKGLEIIKMGKGQIQHGSELLRLADMKRREERRRTPQA